MFDKIKFSVFYLGMKLFLTFLFIAVINFAFINGGLGLFEESKTWLWLFSAIVILVDGSFVFIFAVREGLRDVRTDESNSKRKEDDNEYVYEKKFSVYKGFVAGLIAQVPIIAVYMVGIISSSQNTKNIMDIVVKLLYNQYFQFVSVWGLSAVMFVCFVGGYVLISGFSYMMGRYFRKRTLSKIQRK